MQHQDYSQENLWLDWHVPKLSKEQIQVEAGDKY